MKIKRLLIGMLACSAMVACTNDDLLETPNDNPVLNGDNAYLAIKVVNGSASSRGTSGDFANGSNTENDYSSVDLYFYNGNLFHSKVSDKQFQVTESSGNVEEILGATVVLSNLTSKGVPTSVVAVLNGPEGWDATLIDANSTLQEMYKATTDAEVSTANKFIITNSTSQEDKTLDNEFHFATLIGDGKFMTNEEDAKKANNYVEIFVERLAAKVKLSAEPNADFADGQFKLGQYYVDGTKQDITIDILGWNLNATAKNSYMIKNLPIETQSSIPNYTYGIKAQWDWSDEANHRDYWAASTNYNNGLYYGGFGNASMNQATANKVKDELTIADTDADLTLNYISWNEIGNTDFGKDLYCRENTQTLDILTKADNKGAYVFNGAVTSVLIAAKVTGLGTSTKENGIGLVKYANTMFTDDNFLAYVSNQLNSGNYAYWKDGEKDCWVKFDADFLEISPLHDGYATVALVANPWEVINAKIDAATEDSELKGVNKLTAQTNIIWVNSKNIPVEEVKDSEDNVTTETNIVAYTAANFGITGDIKAEHYKDGMMYYNIPIEHLRGGKMYTENVPENANYYSVTNTKGELVFALREADYGVVRNHYYNITVNKIENLGKAVSKGDEDIIPNTDFSELYYVGATINILSWKIVNQSVDL